MADRVTMQSSCNMANLAVSAAVLGPILICILAYLWIGNWNEFPPGSRCIVSKTLYGTSDMDKALDALNRSLKLKDDFGLSELISNDKVILVFHDTHGLVLDKTYTLGGHYRNIRILSGPDLGKTAWIEKDSLRLDKEPPQNPFRE